MPDTGTGSFRNHRILLAAFLATGMAVTVPVPAITATLEPAEYESNEGYFQLRWDAGEPVRLVEATSRDFVETRILYTGRDSAHVVSGKPDGTWYYRLETADGARVLSEPAVITVRHHSLIRAFSFFTIGAVVFLATLGLILFARPGTDERG